MDSWVAYSLWLLQTRDHEYFCTHDFETELEHIWRNPRNELNCYQKRNEILAGVSKFPSIKFVAIFTHIHKI